MTLLVWPRNRGLQFSFLNSLPSSFSFSRASSGTYFDASGVLQTAASNMPRFDYDPVTLSPRGILMETARTNLLKQSQDFTKFVWDKSGSPITTSNNAGAPDGTATLNKWTRTTTSPSYCQQVITKSASSLPYTFTVFAKAGTVGRYLAIRIQGTYPNRADTCFDLQTGTVSGTGTGGSGFTNTSTITPIGNGIYRCSVSTATTDTETGITSYISFNSNASSQIDTTDSVSNSDGYVWGAQLEQASFPTSYIPTTSAAATRAVDALYTTSLPWFNASQGTSVTRYMLRGASPNGNNRVVHAFNDGTVNNRVTNYVSTAGYDTCAVTSGGTVSVDQYIAGIVSVDNANITAVSYQTNNFAGCRNGGVVSTDTSGAVPIGINRFDLGQRNGGTAPLDGWIQSFRYYNKAVTSAELQRLTVV